MLTNTFIHLDNISYKTERKLWKAGYRSWWDVISSPEGLPVNAVKRERFVKDIRDSIRHFKNDNMVYFANRMKHKDYWRILRHYKNETGYLDIETNMDGSITVVGLFINNRYIAYVRGDDTLKLEWMMSLPSAFVTFNGIVFDMPVLLKEFHFLEKPVLHFDLLKVRKQIGWRGGLKKLEKYNGIERSPRVNNLSGYDAVKLWESHKNGNKEALKTLIEYNLYDVKNLKILTEMFIEKNVEMNYRDLAEQRSE
ncbi:MAG: ribonuclease H-like domain-containing protein [candidate division WOR-3 bacterium]|nr:ribonuclease H-like domain-containing protein [candidate division WOR-3 bacterium]